MAKHRNYGSKKLIRSPEENKPISSVDAVLSKDTLLTEILLRLPVISIHMFKVVSKSWLSLITSPDFTLRRSKIPNIDPPSGLLLPQSQGYKFAPLDIRNTTVFDFGENPMTVKIVQSCNGLLLCCCCLASSKTYYVYNPFIKQSKKLLQRHDKSNLSYLWRRYGGLKMAFDPTKSPHYKVVHADIVEHGWNIQLQIKTYSSGTQSWEICSVQFPYQSFRDFEDGIYWNGSINWLIDGVNMRRFHFELDNVDHPILTEIQTPQNLKGKLFESLKYLINVNGIIKRCPNTWKIPFNWVCTSIPRIVLGEKEDEVFLVMELNGKVAQYNIVTETIRQICHSRVSPSNSFVFIASFAPV
ncbi:F-box protein-like protein isoform X1 [Tanacetum coccineum]